MRKLFTPFVVILFLFSASSCSSQMNLSKTLEKASEVLSDVTGGGGVPLSTEQIAQGLKQALEIGTQNSTNLASKVDGYYKNPLLFIPFPPEAKEMESRLRGLNLPVVNQQIDKFTLTMNRAAEEAAKGAVSVFVGAVRQMTINDAMNILMGADDAATSFFKRTTTAQLTSKFTPIVKKATQKVKLTSAWSPVASKYNQIPFVKKVNPDLDTYVTQKAIDGLFILIQKEEKKIRDNPGARVTDLLKKVFAKQDK